MGYPILERQLGILREFLDQLEIPYNICCSWSPGCTLSPIYWLVRTTHGTGEFKVESLVDYEVKESREETRVVVVGIRSADCH